MSTETANATDSQPAPPVNLKPNAPDAGTNRELNLDVVLDIPVTLSMEVGRSRISIRNLLQPNQVVVNDKFGIRLTDVISPAERIRQLK